MIKLIEHLVHPIVDHPDDVRIQHVEGDAAIVLEMAVHPEDREVFDKDDARAVRSIRNILSAAAGRKKATMDLVDEDDMSPALEE